MKDLQRVQFMDNLDEARKHLDDMWRAYERRFRRYEDCNWGHGFVWKEFRIFNNRFTEAVARYRSLRTQCFPGHKGRLTVVRAD